MHLAQKEGEYIMANNNNIGIIKTEDGIEVYKHDIYATLNDYIVSRNIEDMSKEPQSKWNACLLYIHEIVFYDRKKLLCDNYDSNNLVNGGISNNNAYNLELLDCICNIYIDLCYEYDKEVSIMGFSKLTGIGIDTFYKWYDGDTRKLNPTGREIYKKLIREREETLSNRLYSNRGNPVGILGILNRHYGWNMGQPRGQAEQKTQSLDDIARRYGISQDDKQDTPQITTQEEPPKAEF